MAQDVDQLRQMIVQAADVLFRSGVMQHSGHGNISARLADGRMLITGRGNIRDLTVGDMAVASFDGQALEGHMEPANAEIVAMHAGVYRTRPDVQAIIHAHPPHSTAFALAHRPLDAAYEALLRFGVDEPIPVAAWAPRGSQESVTNIVEVLKAHPRMPAVLLANHGILAFGSSPLEVARLVMAMEEAAEAGLGAQQLGGVKPLPAGALDKERQQMDRFRTRM